MYMQLVSWEDAYMYIHYMYMYQYLRHTHVLSYNLV